MTQVQTLVYNNINYIDFHKAGDIVEFNMYTYKINTDKYVLQISIRYDDS